MKRFGVSKGELLDITSEYLQDNDDGLKGLVKIGGLKGLLDGLQTSVDKGISPDSVAQRRQVFGDATPKSDDESSRSLLAVFAEQFKDPLIIALLVILTLSLIINVMAGGLYRSYGLMESVFLITVVVITMLVLAIRSRNAESNLETSKNELEMLNLATFLRDGKEEYTSAYQGVVGDIVLLKAGDEVCADGLLVEIVGDSPFTVNESCLTGEVDPIAKDLLNKCLERQQQAADGGAHGQRISPILLSGSKVLSGEGKMLVLAVGIDSAIGRIKANIVEHQEVTPLQEKLSEDSTLFGKYGFILAGIFTLLMSARIIYDYLILGGSNGWTWRETHLFVQTFLIAVCLLVITIPETAPLLVSINLAGSVKNMLTNSILVRKLSAVESLARVDVLCTMKTGTLTMNKLFLTKFWNTTSVETLKGSVHPNYREWFPNEAARQLLDQSLLLNNNYDPVAQAGSPTDRAFYEFAMLQKADLAALKAQNPILHKIEFNSNRKMQSTVIKSNGKYLMLVRGASDKILGYCTKIVDPVNGQEKGLTPELKEQADNFIYDAGRESCRTIAFAYKIARTLEEITASPDQGNGVLEFESSGLTLVGIAGIKDIIRPEIPWVVNRLHQDGIRVVMVTGDNIMTAVQVSKDCGIVDKQFDTDVTPGVAIQGGDELGQIANTAEIEKIRVLARSMPQCRYTYVESMQRRGHVVAFIGDGTGDAPSLSKADVGISLGISGTDIAKGASSVILLDDMFSSAARSIHWARNFLCCVEEGLKALIMCGGSIALWSLFGGVIAGERVLSAVQILWLALFIEVASSIGMTNSYFTGDLPKPTIFTITAKQFFFRCVPQMCYNLCVFLVILLYGPLFLPGSTSPAECTSQPIYPSKVPSGLISNFVPPSQRHPCLNSLQPSLHFKYLHHLAFMLTLHTLLSAKATNAMYTSNPAAYMRNLLLTGLGFTLVHALLSKFLPVVFAISSSPLPFGGYLIIYLLGASSLGVGLVLTKSKELSDRLNSAQTGIEADKKDR